MGVSLVGGRGWMGGLRRGGGEAEAPGAAGDDGDFARNGEEGGEVVEVGVGGVGHGDGWGVDVDMVGL